MTFRPSPFAHERCRLPSASACCASFAVRFVCAAAVLLSRHHDAGAMPCRPSTRDYFAPADVFFIAVACARQVAADIIFCHTFASAFPPMREAERFSYGITISRYARPAMLLDDAFFMPLYARAAAATRPALAISPRHAFNARYARRRSAIFITRACRHTSVFMVAPMATLVCFIAIATCHHVASLPATPPQYAHRFCHMLLLRAPCAKRYECRYRDV